MPGMPGMDDELELHSRRIQFGVHCLHIRHKGMYVSPVDPEMDDDQYNELFDSGCHWCAATQTSFGPDGHPVRPELCLDGRACCEH
jgi:hypothetical protein